MNEKSPDFESASSMSTASAGGKIKKVLINTRLSLILLAAFLAFAAFHMRANSGAPLNSRDFVSGIPTIEPDLKLAVAHMDFVKTAAAESRKDYWGFDLGTTRVALSVPARVHYAIDLSGPSPVEFKFDSGQRSLAAVFPDPQVQAVEVFTQKKRTITEVGWGRLGALSGQSLADGLERGLYDGISRDASAPRAVALVREQARTALMKLVARYAKLSGRPDVAVSVSFQSEQTGIAVSSLRPKAASNPL